MSIATPRHYKNPTEVRNVVVDMRGKMDAGELLSGVPVVTELVTTALSFANVAINTIPLVINGQTVAIAQAVQFRVSGGVAGISYTIRITVTTTANPAQTLVEHVVLNVN